MYIYIYIILIIKFIFWFEMIGAGLGCTNDFACSTMANAACRQGVCACKDSYILDINNSSNCVNSK